jgi:endonuclease-8
MPEGNEVHRFRNRQAAIFAGRTVHADSPSGQFPDAGLLDGRKLRGIVAHGKHLGYDFGRDLILHVHLGRFGDFTEGKGPLAEPKGALRLLFWTRNKGQTDWLELRGPSDCSIYDQKKWVRLMARLGPDPLDINADPKPAFAKIAESKAPIGLLLMDQSVISGIGNIYRAELLYRARLSPFVAGRNVDPKILRSIWKDAKHLMADGMIDRRIVTTRSKDRLHRRGPAQREEVHYVYRRRGKPCLVCGTAVRNQEMAGRTLYWCPACQKDSRNT